MTTSKTTTPGAGRQESDVSAVFGETSRAWADGDAEAFAARYTPDATVVLPGIYLPGQDAIRTAMAAAFAGPLKDSQRVHRVENIRFTDPATAIVITDSFTVHPGEPEPPARQRERATWILTRHDGTWLIDAYASSPLQVP